MKKRNWLVATGLPRTEDGMRGELSIITRACTRAREDDDVRFGVDLE